MPTIAHSTEVIAWLLLGALALLICLQTAKLIHDASGAPKSTILLNPIILSVLLLLGPIGLIIVFGYLTLMALGAELNVFAANLFRRHPDQLPRSIK